MKRIGVFTSGGDAPGMNAAIRAVVRTGIFHEAEVYGIYNGFSGMIENEIRQLQFSDVGNILQRGGTILGSARSNEFRTPEGRKKAYSNLASHGIEGLVVIGGDGSFTGAKILNDEFGVPFVGLPGTIDNDLYGTDATIGYDTALNTVVEAVDKIRDTASSHHRIFFVEVMGRNSGFIGLDAGVAVGAEMTLIPEEVTNLDDLVYYLKRIRGKKKSSIILVSEGDDEGGAIDIMNKVKPQLEGFDIRASVLGHMQRGGNPSAADRILASRLGVAATETLIKGGTNLAFGIIGNNVNIVGIEEAISNKEVIDREKLRVIEILSRC
ncbi:6-phosphofructokinase [Wandonia haliotis]|uniref:ATP-dependent 6-phosphofructokinase n=1 Tax=Wandonia haliotis TaxID=574963 RepID=A0ABP3Y361_9FLAO